VAREPAEIADQRRALGQRLAAFRQAAELTQGELACTVFRHRTTVVHVEKGRRAADAPFWAAVDAAVGAKGVLLAAFSEVEASKQDHQHRIRASELAEARRRAASGREPRPAWSPGPAVGDGQADPVALIARDGWATQWEPLDDPSDEEAAVELARRVAASDIGDETLTRLELIVDDLATKYPVTPPAELLVRLRRHLSYVSTLMDKRRTLAEHRRLLVIGGWLSLLAATVHIDLKQANAASARLRTAASLARHTEHREIHGWCYETEAWRVLTDGDYLRALELSRAGQAIAPPGSSAFVQATAQEGRAWARLRQARGTYDAIGRVQKLVSPMPKPDRPEHHYRYDPDKAVAYTATTLAWLGDPAAEPYEREVLARFQPSDDVAKWPRRVASANLDLALTLLVTNRLDEACHAAKQAILSGVVPSNHWRAAEVVQAVETRQLPEARELREAYEAMRQEQSSLE
jgi:DNA-binding XRE family transcriptional regulator